MSSKGRKIKKRNGHYCDSGFEPKTPRTFSSGYWLTRQQLNPAFINKDIGARLYEDWLWDEPLLRRENLRGYLLPLNHEGAATPACEKWLNL